MRVMQSPWGPALMGIAAVLVGLLLIALIAFFFSLALFFVRRSRVAPAAR